MLLQVCSLNFDWRYAPKLKIHSTAHLLFNFIQIYQLELQNNQLVQPTLRKYWWCQKRIKFATGREVRPLPMSWRQETTLKRSGRPRGRLVDFATSTEAYQLLLYPTQLPESCDYNHNRRNRKLTTVVFQHCLRQDVSWHCLRRWPLLGDGQTVPKTLRHQQCTDRRPFRCDIGIGRLWNEFPIWKRMCHRRQSTDTWRDAHFSTRYIEFTETNKKLQKSVTL